MQDKLMNENLPLVVDLDGTLIKTDILYESLVHILLRNPLYIVKIFFVLFSGKAVLKKYLSELHVPNVELLPYNQDVILYIRKAKEDQRKVFLATASCDVVAIRVVNFLGLFDGYFATRSVNMGGIYKSEELIRSFGKNKFEYIGNSTQDIVVFNASKAGVLIASKKFFNKCIKKIECESIKLIQINQNSLNSFIRLLRPHQWLKNLLLLIPLFTAQKFLNAGDIFISLMAFVAFCFMASSVYIVNDLYDIENDRGHRTKKLRPIASGNASILIAIAIAFLLYIAAITMGYYVGTPFLIALLIYGLLTTLYSSVLKEVAIADVVTLSVLYTIRIIAGIIALNVSFSYWLLIFSLLIFFSLALLKRFSEIGSLIYPDKGIAGRGYKGRDVAIICNLGISAGISALVVYCLFIADLCAHLLIVEQIAYWLTVPLLMYWIARIWHMAGNGMIHEDPIIFAAKDKVTYLIGACLLLPIVIRSLL